MRRVFVVLTFVSGLLLGGVSVWLLPQLSPRESIYDRLREAEINYAEKSWSSGGVLTGVDYIQQLWDFESFARVYEEKREGEYTEPTEVSNAFLDSDSNALWVETEDTQTELIVFVGFYLYTERD